MIALAANTRTKPRVIIVEDEYILARGLQKQLESLGYEVAAHVTTGAAAIEQTEKLHPDVVLMDICIEGPTDGIEAASLIRQRCRVPVIFLTAYSNPEILERAKYAEPYGYVLKPYQEQDLRVVIEMALHRHFVDCGAEARRFRLHATLMSIGDAVIATDKQLSINFMNPAAERMTGWTFADAFAQPLQKIVKLLEERTRGAAEPALYRTVREKLRVGLSGAAVLVAKDNSEHPIDECATVIIDGGDAVIGGLLVLREAAKPDSASTETAGLEHLARVARRMAQEFDEFLEFLGSFNELLLVNLPPDDPRRGQLAEILDAGEPAAHLLREFLAYSRKQTRE